MYLSYYRLQRMPFQISPDLRFLWVGEKREGSPGRFEIGGSQQPVIAEVPQLPTKFLQKKLAQSRGQLAPPAFRRIPWGY